MKINGRHVTTDDTATPAVPSAPARPTTGRRTGPPPTARRRARLRPAPGWRARLRPAVGWRARVLAVTAVLLAGALAVVVGVDGSPVWRTIRIALTLIGGAAAGWLLSRPGDGGSGPEEQPVTGAGGRRTARRVGTGMTTLCCGVVGTVVGAGIGVPYALASGPAVLTAAGLVCLATGLTLLGAGVVSLVRAVPGWWRLLAVPVVYLLAQLVLLPCGAAVFATNRAPTQLRAATPADSGLGYEDVWIRTDDGVRLSGWYVPGRNRAAVVLLHGAGSTRSDTRHHGVLLARHGYGVLLLDTRGHGRSGGHAMDWGWYGDADLRAAVSYLAGRPDVDPERIGAVGLSMGGEQALTAAATDPRIKAVVAEGTGVRVAADLAWTPRDVPGWIQRAEAALMYPLADLLTGADRPMPLRDAVAATAPRPVLLIAGRGEEAANRYYRAAAPQTVRLWELPDAPHTGGLDMYPTQWRDQVTGLLDGALLG